MLVIGALPDIETDIRARDEIDTHAYSGRGYRNNKNKPPPSLQVIHSADEPLEKCQKREFDGEDGGPEEDGVDRLQLLVFNDLRDVVVDVYVVCEVNVGNAYACYQRETGENEYRVVYEELVVRFGPDEEAAEG